MNSIPSAAPVEKLVWFRPVDMPEVEILSAENCQRLWSVYHQTYTICTIVKHGGLSEWAYRRRRHVAYNRNLMLMEPGEIHRNIRHTSEGTFYVLQVDPALVETLAREAGVKSTPHWKRAHATAGPLFHAFAQFHAAVAADSTRLERQSLLTEAMRLLLRDCSESGLHPGGCGSPVALRRARDYLHEHYEDHIDLAALAGLAGLSRFHFLRMFARQFGLPPHSYQINLRVEKVRSLLKFGVPISEIETGFADQSHLNRHFKRVLGVTPGYYAAMTGPKRKKY